jgi:hypothetical protein
MHLRTIAVAIISIAVLSACSSTGRLKEYSFNEKRVVFRPIAETPSMSASVFVNDPAPGSKNIWSAIGSIFVSVAGSAAASGNVQQTVSTQGIARILMENMQMSMENRYAITAVGESEGEADFILETRLKHVELSSDPGGVFLHLKAEQVLLDWRDLSVIYKQRFDEHVALRFHPVGGFNPAVNAVVGVVSAVQLLSMDETEIQDAVLATAQDAGRMLADNFVRAVARTR